MVGFHFSVLAFRMIPSADLPALNLFVAQFPIVRDQQAAGAVFGEHGDGIAVDEVELGAGAVVLVGLAFLEGVDEGVLGLGVFGEDVGEAVATGEGIVFVAGFAVVDANPAGVLAVEGLGLGAAAFGHEVGDDAAGTRGVGLGVGGERGLVGGAEAVALGGRLALALVGAGVVGLGEPAIVVALIVAGGAVGDRFGGLFGEGLIEESLDLRGKFGVVGEQLGEARGEGAGGLGGGVCKEALQGLGKGSAVGLAQSACRASARPCRPEVWRFGGLDVWRLRVRLCPTPRGDCGAVGPSPRRGEAKPPSLQSSKPPEPASCAGSSA